MGVHVLVLPWASQGHLTPALQFAQILASQQDFLITLVLTARAQARLQAASSPLPQQPNIRIQVMDDGLDPDPAHAPSLEQLMASFPTMQQSLETLLQALMASSSPVTCLIATTFCFWSRPITRKLDIPHVELWSSPAYIYCCGFFFEHFYSAGFVPFKGRKEDTLITCIPGLPTMKASDYIQEQMPNEEEVQADPDIIPRLRSLLNESHQNARDQFRILANSVYDFESAAFDALRAEHVPICAIGPLFLHDLCTGDADQPFKQPRTSLYKEDRTCLQWLDSKAPASTLYVAFGSDCKMEKQAMHELAYGLEASQHSFLWVIRPGSVLGDISMDEALPEGFKERVGERGLVVSWVPQTDVLAHVAIGGFLSHCGWNSTLEALWFRIPILAWPQRVDQPVNKKYIEDVWKVGIAIEKNEEGKICRGTIEDGIRSLLEGEKGAYIRQAGKEVQELMRKAVRDGGSSRTNLNQFIQDLRSLPTAHSHKET